MRMSIIITLKRWKTLVWILKKSFVNQRIVYNLREELDVDWAKKQREIQKRKNYEENQKKIGQNILNIEKSEEEFDWDQVKIPGLTIKGSAPQEMMVMYSLSFDSSIMKINLGVSIVQLFKRPQVSVIKSATKEELVKYLAVLINLS